MSKAITLDLPDQVYHSLAELAAKEGRSAEEVGADWLATFVQHVADDPLMRLAGTLESGTPDLAERHDDYLAGHVRDELQDQEP